MHARARGTPNKATKGIHHVEFPTKKDSAAAPGEFRSVVEFVNCGKRLRKKRLTFGLSKLFKNPRRNAWAPEVLSPLVVIVWGRRAPKMGRNFLVPKYTR